MIFDTSLEDLDFADDISLLAQRIMYIQNKSNDLVNYIRQIGFRVNNKKTKIMQVKSTIGGKVKTDNSKIEEVDSFVHLGSRISANETLNSDI